jgi:hypothetical protein
VFDWAGAFGLFGMISICVALLVLGQLSYRLGRVTRAESYYIGFYVAAGFIGLGVIARIVNLGDRLASISELHQNVRWALLYNGAPAVGATIGVIVAWRYWSWLLTERG